MEIIRIDHLVLTVFDDLATIIVSFVSLSIMKENGFEICYS
jgi:hypothetical protein